VINAAGLGAAKVAKLFEADFPLEVYPCRGEYYILDKDSSEILKTAVYPLPPADGSGLGVHLTPSYNNNILIGPSAEYIDDSADLANTEQMMAELKTEAYELLPELKGYSFIKNYAGIRPKLFNSAKGTNFEDFYIEKSRESDCFLNLIGIESPGLTSAPAIAAYILKEFIAPKIELQKNTNFNGRRQGVKRWQDYELSELQEFGKSNPELTEIICRCEKISKAEIRAALANPLGAKTISAVKKRTHAAMGRCQGGFCLPQIISFMTEELKLKPEEIVKSNENGEITRGYNHERA